MGKTNEVGTASVARVEVEYWQCREKEGRQAGGGRATHVPTDGGGREERERGRPIRELQTHRFFVRRGPSNLADPFRDRKGPC